MITLTTTQSALIGIIALAATAAFGAWISLANRNFFFGRSIPRELFSTPPAHAITRNFMLHTGACFLLSVAAFLILLAAGHFSHPALVSSEIAFFLEIILVNFAVARAHREAGLAFPLDHQTEAAAQPHAVEVSLLSTAAFPTVNISTLAQPLGFAALIWLGSNLLSHLSFSDFVDAVSLGGGAFLTGLGLGMLAGSTAFLLLLRYSSRHRTAMARVTMKTMMLLGWFGALAIAVAALAVPFHHPITHASARIFVLIGAAIAIVFQLYINIRSKQFTPPAAELGGDRFWRWGLYYYNPSDPSLFVQRRIGIGYTLNFANALSWLIVLAFVADFGFLFVHKLHL